MKESIVFTRSKQFATRIIQLYRHLCTDHHEYIISKQILRSGTSIGANIAEGRFAQSDADFITKYSISLKECSETIYWLELLHDNTYISDTEHDSLNADAVEIIKLLTSSLKTIKSRQK